MEYDREHGWTATFRGVVAAPLTPFDDDGGLRLDKVPTTVEYLLDGGVSGLMVGGTTGEFIALETEERQHLLAAFVAAVNGRVPIIAHVGHVDRQEAIRLAHHASKAGASATTAITPYYHRVTDAAAAEYFRAVANATPDLPFFVYNYPDAAGQEVPFSLFRSLLDLPNLAGAKHSVGTFEELEPYLDLPGHFCIMAGNDFLAPRFLRAGGRAIVSGNAAAFPDVLSRLVAAVEAADEVAYQSAWAQLKVVVEVGRSGAPDRLRQLLNARNIPVGNSRITTFTSGDIPAEHEEAILNLLRDLTPTNMTDM